MKQLLMLTVSALLGTTFASTTVTLGVEASVSSMCVFLSTPILLNPGNTLSLKQDAPEVARNTRTAYTVQCTRGTPFAGITKGQGAILLQGTLAAPVVVATYTDLLNTSAPPGQGDTYTLQMTLSFHSGDDLFIPLEEQPVYFLDYN